MDRLGVINMALLKAALPLAASLSECDWNADFVFDNMAEQALRMHAWGFAQRFSGFEVAQVQPSFGYRNAYLMPQDCIRVLSIWQGTDIRAPKSEFRASGRYVYSNAAPCNGVYVSRDLDPDNWPADFTDAVACRIAAEIAGLSAEKLALVPQLLQLYQYSLGQAAANDAREERARVPLDQSFSEARGSAGSGRR